MMEKRGINIMCVQETKGKGAKATDSTQEFTIKEME